MAFPWEAAARADFLPLMSPCAHILRSRLCCNPLALPVSWLQRALQVVGPWARRPRTAMRWLRCRWRGVAAAAKETARPGGWHRSDAC
eukprot:308919-Pyramimonas_sp.AAC.1